MSFFTFLVLLVSTSFVLCQIPDVATQLMLKQRGQNCLTQILPPSPQALAYQTQLAICFSVDCYVPLIQQVVMAYPQYYPQLRACMGY
ncbi:unnamed protein product [Caenorhabditis auriculariae]|uniref:Uncharacterized protein n=1 Tax=Caenorhabditis auriculariae TaxID=2777116 RepID=A0A8S1HTN7_9PELO|nr:unnamed protein product [Caenorhabditis auriculariae]